MAELNAEIVREIVQETVKDIVVKEVNGLRLEMHDGINRILETIQSLTDEDRDEMSGITGRLRNHNERIAKLERLSNLR